MYNIIRGRIVPILAQEYRIKQRKAVFTRLNG